jgi:phosphate transport system protein
VNIAVRVREMGAFANIDLPVDIPKLASLSSAMVRKSLQAFIEADAELAQSVLTLDDQVDEMNRDAFRALGDLIKEKPELAPQALNALIISRNLERVGDHATNIAEDVIFWVRGKDVRHRNGPMP